jgi:hypothetical protein
MTFRLVSSADAKTAADAEAFVISDTGGQVVPISGKTTEVSNGWRVEVYSTDGRTVLPLAAGREFFRVLAISKDGKFARLRDAFKIEYDYPRELPGFGSKILGMEETVTLQVGQTISAVVSGGNLVEVLVEEGEGAFVERPQVESLGPVPQGYKIEEARNNYDEFRSLLKTGAAPTAEPQLVPEPKSDEAQHVDDMRKLLERIGE